MCVRDFWSCSFISLCYLSLALICRRYYYSGSSEYYFNDINTKNAGSGYGIRRMGYWDILQYQTKRGRKYTPGTGSRYSGRGVLMDSENMGPRAVGYPGPNQPYNNGGNVNDQGYYNPY